MDFTVPSTLLPASDTAENLGLSTVVAIASHPDDLDFGAAGTIAGLTQAGTRVVYCILTSGDAGGFEPGQRDQMSQRRQAEQRAAAAQVGVTDVEFLNFADGYIEPNHELIKQLVAVMRKWQPQAVITSHPEREWTRLQRSHPDHLACGEAVARAVYPAVENPFAYPELAEQGLEAFRLRWLVMMGGPNRLNNLLIDVTQTAELKLAALNEHHSQHPDPDKMRHFVLRQLAEQHPGHDDQAEGAQERMAEAFHLVEVNGQDTIAGF